MSDLAELLAAADAYLHEARIVARDHAIASAQGTLRDHALEAFGVTRDSLLTKLAIRASGVREGPPADGGWDPEIEAALDRARPGLTSGVQVATARSLVAGGNATALDLGFQASFDLANPRALTYVTQHAADAVTGIDETTRGRLRALFGDAVRNGWSYATTRDEILKAFEGFSASRAEMIARTETIGAYAEGNLQMGKQLADAGLDMEKAWIVNAPQDEICLGNEADGWIPLDDSFSSGDDRPPGHPNCECDVLIRRVGSDASATENVPPPPPPARDAALAVDARASLEAFENLHRTDSVESALVVDHAGQTIVDKSQGIVNRVEFTQAEADQMAGQIATHNHPGGSAFSVDDLAMLRSAKLFEIRVARNGDGTMAARVTEKGLALDPVTFRNELKRADRDVYATIMARYRRDEITSYQANKIHHDEVADLLVQRGLITISREEAP